MNPDLEPWGTAARDRQDTERASREEPGAGGDGLLVAETPRLTIRRLTEGDAPFILELLNDPSFLRFIGDRGVRTLDEARDYLQGGPIASYAEHGFGLFLTERREGQVPVGICGLLRRTTLDDVDIGFALLPQYAGQGYALEAAGAVLALGKGTFGLTRIVAVVQPDNVRSRLLLQKLGMTVERLVRLAEGGPDLELFA